MIVCICRNVSDRAIGRLVADGAGSPEEVALRCGAGTDCGSCRRAVARLVAECRDASDADRVALRSAAA